MIVQKTGWRKIDYSQGGQKLITCQSCLAIATKRVTFEDLYGKLVVSLCDECAEKEYAELLTQGRFSWPVTGDEVV